MDALSNFPWKGTLAVVIDYGDCDMNHCFLSYMKRLAVCTSEDELYSNLILQIEKCTP